MNKSHFPCITWISLQFFSSTTVKSDLYIDRYIDIFERERSKRNALCIKLNIHSLNSLWSLLILKMLLNIIQWIASWIYLRSLKNYFILRVISNVKKSAQQSELASREVIPRKTSLKEEPKKVEIFIKWCKVIAATLKKQTNKKKTLGYLYIIQSPTQQKYN